MKLINTTSSHSVLVHQQLENTDAILVETFSAGNTDVVFTQAEKHYEILISNQHRPIQMTEAEQIREYFLKRKIDTKHIDKENIRTLHSPKLIEISIPVIAS